MNIGDSVEISVTGKIKGMTAYGYRPGVQYTVEIRDEQDQYLGLCMVPAEAFVLPSKEEYKASAGIGQPEEPEPTLGNEGDPIPDEGLSDYLYEQERDRRHGL